MICVTIFDIEFNIVDTYILARAYYRFITFFKSCLNYYSREKIHIQQLDFSLPIVHF